MQTKNRKKNIWNVRQDEGESTTVFYPHCKCVVCLHCMQTLNTLSHTWLKFHSSTAELRWLPSLMSSDLSDVCGSGGAGGFWGDGLSTEQHARVQVTVSVHLFGKVKTLNLLYTSLLRFNLTLVESKNTCQSTGEPCIHIRSYSERPWVTTLAKTFQITSWGYADNSA